MGGIIHVDISEEKDGLFANGLVEAKLTGEGRCIVCGSAFANEHLCVFRKEVLQQ